MVKIKVANNMPANSYIATCLTIHIHACIAGTKLTVYSSFYGIYGCYNVCMYVLYACLYNESDIVASSVLHAYLRSYLLEPNDS